MTSWRRRSAASSGDRGSAGTEVYSRTQWRPGRPIDLRLPQGRPTIPPSSGTVMGEIGSPTRRSPRAFAMLGRGPSSRPDARPQRHTRGSARRLGGRAEADGWRALVAVDGALEVRTRRGRVIAESVPELADLANPGLRVVLDGELVVARRAASRSSRSMYRRGQRSTDWRKVKCETWRAVHVER